MNQSSTYLQATPRTTTIDPLKAIADGDDYSVLKNYERQQKQHDRSEKKKKKKKRERRSKDDNHERNFICGCGKSYLSYAALYTHAKTKHDGVFPEGTTTLNKKKQGRPKKEEWCASKINSAYQKTYDFNKDFQHYLEMIPGAKEEKENTIKDIISSFPCELFKDQKYYESILLKISKINQELINNFGNTYLNQIEIIMFDIQNTKRLNCNEIFALFLIYIFRFVSNSFFRDLVFFVICYRIMMNDRGWDKCKEINDGYEFNSDQEFCEVQGAEFIPDLSNVFILEYFVNCVQQKQVLANNQNLNFFGLESINLLRVILFIKHFCTWLFIHKFTKGKIDIFKDQEERINQLNYN